MHRVHHFLSAPPNDTKVWRYLDLSHFLWLLSRRALYFASVLEFDDLWEGALPTGAIVGGQACIRAGLGSRGATSCKQGHPRHPNHSCFGYSRTCSGPARGFMASTVGTVTTSSQLPCGSCRPEARTGSRFRRPWSGLKPVYRVSLGTYTSPK
jgi:hypothetical protein